MLEEAMHDPLKKKELEVKKEHMVHRTCGYCPGNSFFATSHC